MEKPTFRFKEPKAKKLPSYVEVNLFPVSVGLSCGTHNRNLYSGRLVGDSIHIDQTNDVASLYAMGCFGKGNLSWSNPQYNVKPKDNHIPVMSRRRYLMHRKWAVQQGSTVLQCNVEDKLPYKRKSKSASTVNTNSQKMTSVPDILKDEVQIVASCLPLKESSSLSDICAVSNTCDLVVEPDPWLEFEPSESEAFWGKCDNGNNIWKNPAVDSCSSTKDSHCDGLPQQILEKSDVEVSVEPMDCEKLSSTMEQASELHDANCIVEIRTDRHFERNDSHKESAETDHCPTDQDATESAKPHDFLFSVDDAKLVCDSHMRQDVCAVVALVGSDVLNCDSQIACGGPSDALETDDRQERDDDVVDVCVVNDTEDSDIDEERPTWRTVLKKDPYPLSEHLILSLEEAYFLSYGFGCLVVNDSNNRPMNLTEMWRTFCSISSEFPFRYAVYHNYRSKAWVPKSGLKFGVDFLLYKWGPSYYHATYSVVVKTVRASDFVAVRSTSSLASNWTSLSCLNRVTEQVSKELMLCYVIVPDELLDADLASPTCLAKFKITNMESQVKEILIEVQKQVELNSGIKHTKDEEKLVDGILEGDIMLTMEQAEVLLVDSTARRRRKRKLAEPASKRWSLPIPYTFDGTHNAAEVKRIKDALAYWEDLTCITFKEDNKAQFKLLFVRQRGCWSYVGFTRQPNQTVSIGDGCQSNGTIAHEVGHAVGFWHEQSRPDRDVYVTIHEENITDGKLYNFQTRTWGEVGILNVPYDLGSGMHYGAKFYAKDVNGTLTTMETRDPLMMRVIGQRQELSFYDVKLANKAYCNNVCMSYGIPLRQPCRRDGYQDPKNCWRCRCPDGFGGNYCEKVQPSVNAYCGGGVLDARNNGTIYSPGYRSTGYRPDIQCNWLIRAPENWTIYLEFVDEFGITGHVDVCRDFVEVRYNTSLALTGARFCCSDPPRRPIKSDSNEMLILFRSYSESLVCDDVKFPSKCKVYNTGFKAKFYSKPCGGCGSKSGSGAFAPCLRRVPYWCTQIWEQKVKIDCPPWWQSDSCGTRTVTNKRVVPCYRDRPYCCEPYLFDGNQCVGNAVPSDPVQPITVAKTTTTTTTTATSPTSPVPAVEGAGTWTEWTDWGECSRQCGGGTAVRTRTCVVSGTCGSTNIQADKRPCSQLACFNKCPIKKQILCDLWTTCTKLVYEKCNAYCYDGFTLFENRCVLTGVT